MAPVVTLDRDQAKALEFRSLGIARGRCWFAPCIAESLGLGDPKSLTGLIDRIMDPKQQRRHLKKDVDRSLVDVVEVDGQRWVIKTYRVSPWVTRLYHCFRMTPAWREWRGAFELVAAGCRANPPLALVDDQAKGADAQSLIMTYIDAVTFGPTLDRWANLQGQDALIRRRRLALAEAMGRQIGKILAADLIIRDYKPANLMIDQACAQDGAEPVIIDPLGVRKRSDEDRRLRMLATLLRTSLNDGPFTFREVLTLLRALGRYQVSLGAGRQRRVRWIIDQSISRLPADAKQRLLQSFKS